MVHASCHTAIVARVGGGTGPPGTVRRGAKGRGPPHPQRGAGGGSMRGSGGPPGAEQGSEQHSQWGHARISDPETVEEINVGGELHNIIYL